MNSRFAEVARFRQKSRAHPKYKDFNGNLSGNCRLEQVAGRTVMRFPDGVGILVDDLPLAQYCALANAGRPEHLERYLRAQPGYLGEPDPIDQIALVAMATEPRPFGEFRDQRAPFVKQPPSSGISSWPKAEDEDSLQKVFEELLAKYEAAICTSKELETLPIKPRKFLVGQWMREGDTGFVYGERGSGKTWFIDAIATHLSTGTELFDWTIPEAVDVLLIDGEMPGDETRLRLMGMSPKNERLYVLHHELLFDRTGLAMNLTDPQLQRVITELCIRKNIKLLILDNLSCLFSALKENDADEWEKALNWLLDLRRRRIAVLIVHHAGKSGQMRGTTRREDSAFWVIRIEEVKGRSTEEKGARFQITFTKQRNSDSPEWNREVTFQTEANGEISIGSEGFSFDGKVLQLIQDGLSTATEIAEELGVAKSTVSKAAKRLLDAKLIEKRGRNYEPRGVMRK